ncbi:MAG: hypothetical protein ACTSQE_04660 [Candidatus Heimdallarchaeaceae archaeon]
MRPWFRISIIVLCILLIIPELESRAYDDGLEENDLITYGFHLIVDGKTIEYHDEYTPVRILFNEKNIKPVGLYKRMLGMKLGVPKSFDVPPEEGFDASDPQWGYLAGKTLHYQNVEIYSVEGVDTNTNNNGSGNANILEIIVVILGITGSFVVAFGIYRIYPKIFFKRCSICKARAVGKCSSCHELFCTRCFSNGCPKCKSRTLIRLKK